MMNRSVSGFLAYFEQSSAHSPEPPRGALPGQDTQGEFDMAAALN